MLLRKKTPAQASHRHPAELSLKLRELGAVMQHLAGERRLEASLEYTARVGLENNNIKHFFLILEGAEEMDQQ